MQQKLKDLIYKNLSTISLNSKIGNLIKQKWEINKEDFGYITNIYKLETFKINNILYKDLLDDDLYEYKTDFFTETNKYHIITLKYLNDNVWFYSKWNINIENNIQISVNCYYKIK